MPGLTFTTPDHALELLSRSNAASTKKAHQLPTFEAEHSEPILYLPPLLSSLPTTYPDVYSTRSTTLFPPIITETRLPDIDPASLSLHRALHHFRPVDDMYAAKPYSETFNWDELELPEEEERDWFCVAFRSLRKEGSDGGPLYEADKQAHEEAISNGGLIMYWYGVPSPETGLNLATCIWQSRLHAVAANGRAHHVRAAQLAKEAYERYDLERWVLRKRRGERGVHIEPYHGGPVGW